jgi:hypothetical protein
MAKKKKKPTPPRTAFHTVGKQHIERMRASVAKLLFARGLDPMLIDFLSRRQQDVIYHVVMEAPRCKVAKGSRVHKDIIRYLNDRVCDHLLWHYYLDPEFKVTLLEACTHGVAFAMGITMLDENLLPNMPPPTLVQQEVIHEIARVFNRNDYIQELGEIVTLINMCVMTVSKVNFRVYGFDWRVPGDFSNGRFHSTIHIISEEARPIHFKHQGTNHVAYRVRKGQINNEPAEDASINKAEVTGNPADENETLEIYIQPHALMRVKERIDILVPTMRNLFAMRSLIFNPRIERGPDGQPFLVCYHKRFGTTITYGYFPFIVQGEKLIILSFFTPALLGTPEGTRLCRRLRLQREDLAFLGMDKLSFCFTIDFPQIPVLKEAIDKTVLYQFTVHERTRYLVDMKIDPVKTAFVKKFFEQRG